MRSTTRPTPAPRRRWGGGVPPGRPRDARGFPPRPRETPLRFAGATALAESGMTRQGPRFLLSPLWGAGRAAGETLAVAALVLRPRQGYSRERASSFHHETYILTTKTEARRSWSYKWC